MTGQMPHVIIEGNPLSDDEEDKIIEAAVLDQAISDMSFLGNDIMAQGEQGKLVEQILLAQQEMAPLPVTEQVGLIFLFQFNFNSQISIDSLEHSKTMFKKFQNERFSLSIQLQYAHFQEPVVHLAIT